MNLSGSDKNLTISIKDTKKDFEKVYFDNNNFQENKEFIINFDIKYLKKILENMKVFSNKKSSELDITIRIGGSFRPMVIESDNIQSVLTPMRVG